MNTRVIGWGLLLSGAGLSLAEGLAIADSNITGTAFEETVIGKIENKIPNPTPFELGTLLLIAGAFTLWVWPLISEKL